MGLGRTRACDWRLEWLKDKKVSYLRKNGKRTVTYARTNKNKERLDVSLAVLGFPPIVSFGAISRKGSLGGSPTIHSSRAHSLRDDAEAPGGGAFTMLLINGYIGCDLG
jgi:hypothetical protein